MPIWHTNKISQDVKNRRQKKQCVYIMKKKKCRWVVEQWTYRTGCYFACSTWVKIDKKMVINKTEETNRSPWDKVYTNNSIAYIEHIEVGIRKLYLRYRDSIEIRNISHRWDRQKMKTEIIKEPKKANVNIIKTYPTQQVMAVAHVLEQLVN